MRILMISYNRYCSYEINNINGTYVIIKYDK